MGTRREGINITLGDVKDNVQYYVINLYSVALDIDIAAHARYNDFQAFYYSLPNRDAISVPFPKKKGPFSIGTKGPDEIEKRRLDLQQWIKEVYKDDQKEVLKFTKAKQQQYGKPVDTNQLINAGDDPWPLYADGYAYDPIAKNWAPFVRNFGSYYHRRCLFDLSTCNLNVSYLPWGQTTQLANMKELRVFPESNTFPYRLAFTGDFVWVYRLGVLASFDLLNSKWEVVQNMPPKLVKFQFTFDSKYFVTYEMEQKRKEVIMTNDSFMGSVGQHIYLLNDSAHHVYNSEKKTWSQLPKCNVKDFRMDTHITLSGYFWIHAHEYIYLFVKSATPMFPRYNLLRKVWDACPNPSSEQVVNCTWDHHNKIYMWSTNKAYVYFIDRAMWVQDESIYLKTIGVAYCTDDFNPGWSEDVELRSSIINNGRGDIESWEDMHKHNRITREECEFMEQMESLPVGDKVQYFRKNRDFAIQTFKSPIINNNGRTFQLALQLAQEDPILGSEMSKLFKFYTTMEEGQPRYFPSSAEGVQKMMASGNRSHLYSSSLSSSFFPSSSSSSFFPSLPSSSSSSFFPSLSTFPSGRK